MSKDNFKDDFERNRQEIKPDHTNEFNDQSENEETSFDIRDEQQHFPPRNASRRHRKRDLNSDDYQAQEHVQENSHNSHSEKRPGLLGGFVNKQQDTSHREDSAELARTNGQGEKIRDYAKEHPHEIQNQPKENHSNNRELKSEQQRDQRRDIHNPEKGKDVHRSNINNVSREDRAKQEPHGQFKKSSEKDVNHTRSNNNSYSQEQQHKKLDQLRAVIKSIIVKTKHILIRTNPMRLNALTMNLKRLIKIIANNLETRDLINVILNSIKKPQLERLGQLGWQVQLQNMNTIKSNVNH